MSKIVPFQTVQFNISTQFECKYSVYLSKTFLFQAIQFSQTVLIQIIQFSISMQFSSIEPIARALSGATNPGQSGPGTNGNEGVLRIPPNSCITGTSSSDCWVSYPGHSLRGLTPLHSYSQCILQPQPTGRSLDGISHITNRLLLLLLLLLFCTLWFIPIIE